MPKSNLQQMIVQPSADLAKIIGEKPLARSQVSKRLWDYINRKGLQDKENRRMINADENLQKVFGGKAQVGMFEMISLVNRHLTKVAPKAPASL